MGKDQPLPPGASSLKVGLALVLSPLPCPHPGYEYRAEFCPPGWGATPHLGVDWTTWGSKAFVEPGNRLPKGANALRVPVAIQATPREILLRTRLDSFQSRALLYPRAGSSLGPFPFSTMVCHPLPYVKNVPESPKRLPRLINTRGIYQQGVEVLPSSKPSPRPSRSPSPPLPCPWAAFPVVATVIPVPAAHPSPLPAGLHAEHLQDGPS